MTSTPRQPFLVQVGLAEAVVAGDQPRDRHRLDSNTTRRRRGAPDGGGPANPPWLACPISDTNAEAPVADSSG